MTRSSTYGIAVLVTLALLALGVSSTLAETINELAMWRVEMPLWTFYSGGCDTPGNCVEMVNGTAYTWDKYAGVELDLEQVYDSEVTEWRFLRPDGTNAYTFSATWHADTYCWEQSDGGSTCCNWQCPTPTRAYWMVAVAVECGMPGPWTTEVRNNGVLALTEHFTLMHDPVGPIGITAPADNQIFQMTQQNFTTSDVVPFSANANGGAPINWTASLHYLTAGGYGGPDPAARTFSTASGAEHDETYQSVGGQIKVTAQTTTSTGSTVRDCVTFYVDGPHTGIPNTTITGRLDGLYPGSQSYPSGGTPNLMTGVAMHESTYTQFRYPSEGNSDLFGLYGNLGLLAKWPYESQQDGGSHVGLMQVGTTDPDAWNWLTNTADAVNLFSGTVSPNKMSLALTYENDIINGVKNPKIPGHIGLRSLTGTERENMALVLYRGAGLSPDLATRLTQQYYAPVCSGTVQSTNQGLKCQGGTWNWVVNSTGQPVGVAYVSSTTNPLGVRNQLQ